MLCEAAHLPSIWATEVLDRLAKKGVPARGEVSDVVMAGRAECIMLNKGPYITLAIRGLDRVLSSLQAYREKRAVRLPALRLSLPDATEVGREIGDRQGRWEDPATRLSRARARASAAGAPSALRPGAPRASP